MRTLTNLASSPCNFSDRTFLATGQPCRCWVTVTTSYRIIKPQRRCMSSSWKYALPQTSTRWTQRGHGAASNGRSYTLSTNLINTKTGRAYVMSRETSFLSKLQYPHPLYCSGISCTVVVQGRDVSWSYSCRSTYRESSISTEDNCTSGLGDIDKSFFSFSTNDWFFADFSILNSIYNLKTGSKGLIYPLLL